MVSSYTTNSGIEKPATGDQSGTWGATVNTNMDILDTIVSGFVQITASSTSETLTTTDGTVTNGMNRAIKYVDGGDLGGNCTVTISPNDQEKLLFVENGLSASRTLIFSQGSGANFTLQNGKQAIIRSDGAGSGAAVTGVYANIQISTLECEGAAAIDGATTFSSTVTVGVDDTGYDVKLFGATSGAYMLWDESADDLKLVGAAGLTVAGDIDVDGTTNLDAVDIDGAVQIDGTVTVGVDDTGYDVKFFGDTASAYMLWDTSADDLILGGSAGLSVAGVASATTQKVTSRLFIGDIATSVPVSNGQQNWTQSHEASNRGGMTWFSTHNSAGGAETVFAKGRGGSIGSYGVVSDDDTLGAITWCADDGTDMNSVSARILANVDGTPGSNDTPGRLTFWTTADGAAASTEQMRIDNAGKVTVDKILLASTDTDTSNTGSVTLDFSINQNFVLTFTGNVTLANPSTESVGQSGVIVCIQDGTGSRTLSLGTDYETAASGGITLSTGANDVDVIPYFVKAAGSIQLGAVQLDFG